VGVGMTGQGCRDEGGRQVSSSCLCGFVRDTLAQLLALAGRRARALWARGQPLTQWSLSDQSGGLIPPLACGRGILVFPTLRHPTFRHAELVSASYFLRAVGIKILKQVQDDG
jgi:hypothetical protein